MDCDRPVRVSRDACPDLEASSQFIVDALDRSAPGFGSREGFRLVGRIQGADRLVAQHRDDRPLAARLGYAHVEAPIDVLVIGHDYGLVRVHAGGFRARTRRRPQREGVGVDQRELAVRRRVEDRQIARLLRGRPIVDEVADLDVVALFKGDRQTGGIVDGRIRSRRWGVGRSLGWRWGVGRSLGWGWGSGRVRAGAWSSVGARAGAGASVGAWAGAGASVGAWAGAGASVGAWAGAGASVGAWGGAGAAVGAGAVWGASVGAWAGAGASVGAWAGASAGVGAAVVAGWDGGPGGVWSATTRSRATTPLIQSLNAETRV